MRRARAITGRSVAGRAACGAAALFVLAGAYGPAAAQSARDGLPSHIRTEEGRVVAVRVGDLPPPDATGTENAPADSGAAYAAGVAFYDSVEMAAVRRQFFRAVTDFAYRRWAALNAGRPVASVVLSRGATAADPGFTACAGKPLAVLFKVEGGVLRDAGDGEESAMPGAVAAVNGLRARGIAVLFLSKRTVLEQARVAGAIGQAGLGAAVPGETLFFDDGRGREEARQQASGGHCVLAMAGNALADFARQAIWDEGDDAAENGRVPVARAMLDALWGDGWFLLADPLNTIAVSPRQTEETREMRPVRALRVAPVSGQ